MRAAACTSDPPGPAPVKTNAGRLLEAAGVPCRTLPYDLPEERFSAEAVADQLGLPPGQVFKTLATVGSARGPVFALIPAGSVLSLKKLARLLGDRRLEMAPLADVLRLTGYRRGAVTVPGAKRSYPAAVDESALEWERIAVSAGAPGAQLLVETAAYLRFISAITGPIASDVPGAADSVAGHGPHQPEGGGARTTT